MFAVKAMTKKKHKLEEKSWMNGADMNGKGQKPPKVLVLSVVGNANESNLIEKKERREPIKCR